MFYVIQCANVQKAGTKNNYYKCFLILRKVQSKRASPEPPDRRPFPIHSSTNILFTFK
nr:MAG TPA: hypothetical protein [Herelleviridae sp.]DAR48335.1 MAG TPA: hypothetical protein [Caudoviricetes sp.]